MFQKHPILKHLLLMVAVSVVVLTVVFLGIKLYARQGHEFELPDMVGADIEDMRADASLDINYVIIDSIYDEHDAGGRILSQDPKAGTRVKKGRKVYVSITAYSADKTFLPDLCDLSVRQAVSQLFSMGLQGGTLRFVESPDRNAVLSLSQNGRTLQAGQEVSRGSRIDMVVGLGDEGGYTVVPFVIGKNAKEARRDVLTASMNVGREIYDAGASRANAVVYRQEPGYTGITRYPLGTEVHLYYRDASEQEAERMIREFKIDSSDIVQPEEPSAEPMDDSYDLEW
ncbi:MAG: PASTA domain-containing protein [bacterium P3]|nr:MAG: PASTA domain-containing protein [bacterium P3]KWW42436.1 MAG: PASTA domain-containing protein [bacterium F083]